MIFFSHTNFYFFIFCFYKTELLLHFHNWSLDNSHKPQSLIWEVTHSICLPVDFNCFPSINLSFSCFFKSIACWSTYYHFVHSKPINFSFLPILNNLTNFSTLSCQDNVPQYSKQFTWIIIKPSKLLSSYHMNKRPII